MHLHTLPLPHRNHFSFSSPPLTISLCCKCGGAVSVSVCMVCCGRLQKSLVVQGTNSVVTELGLGGGA